MLKHILYTVVIPSLGTTLIIFFIVFIVSTYMDAACILDMAETDLRDHFSYDICHTSKGRGIVEKEYDRVMEEQYRLMEEWLEERK